MRSTVEEVPVLFAGGGLVGLSTAMFLAQHGISSLAIERLRGGSPVPRAAFFHMRTLEMFRAAGIEDQVREQSAKEFEPVLHQWIVDQYRGWKKPEKVAEWEQKLPPKELDKKEPQVEKK